MFDTPETAEEAIIKEKLDKKVIYIVVGVVLLLAVLFLFISQGNKFFNNQSNSSASNSSEIVKIVSIGGEVLAVDSEDNQLTITIIPAKTGLPSEDSFIGEKRTIEITPSTRIQKLVVSRDEEGSVNRAGSVSINVSDIEKNDQLSIEYLGQETDEVLEKVKSISLIIDADDFDMVYQEESQKAFDETFSGVLGEIESVDVGLQAITYRSYNLDGLGEQIFTAAVGSEAKIYSVASADLLPIKHARTEISWDDVKVYDKVFVVIDSATGLPQQNISAQSIIIVKGE
jgi:hypothetical protein